MTKKSYLLVITAFAAGVTLFFAIEYPKETQQILRDIHQLMKIEIEKKKKDEKT